MLDQFNNRQLEAVARMLNYHDFDILCGYLEDQVTSMALKSVNLSGDECERMKGACQGLKDLVNKIRGSQTAFDEKQQIIEANRYKGDPFSP